MIRSMLLLSVLCLGCEVEYKTGPVKSKDPPRFETYEIPTDAGFWVIVVHDNDTEKDFLCVGGSYGATTTRIK